MIKSDDENRTLTVNEEKINGAYEALEKMRKMNLELQCSNENVMYDSACCTTCLLSGQSSSARFPRLAKWAQQEQEQEEHNSTPSRRFPRIRQLLLHNDRRQRPTSPQCLICGTPVCQQHASKDFAKEGVTVCFECEHLFGLQFVIDFLTQSKHETQTQQLDHLLDTYDRVVLLLKYSSQYIPTIATQLEQSKQRQNHIGLGSSGVGVISGALGIVAAATILTPVGPPLLVASLLFGGGSTAVQTGSEAVIHYYSEPLQVAKRILALHRMLWSILQITSVLRDAMMREHVRSEFYQTNTAAEVGNMDHKLHQALKRKKQVVRSAAGGLTTVGRYSVTAVSAEVSQAGSQSARIVSRSSTNLLLGARVARFAGGAMSAAVLLLEARNVNDTLHEIQSGSPCDKATRLRDILEEVSNESSIPETSSLDRELYRYLNIMHQREKVWTEEEVATIILEQNSSPLDEQQLRLEEQQEHPEEGERCIVQGDDTSTKNTVSSQKSNPENRSLLERIALFKQQEKTTEDRGTRAPPAADISICMSEDTSSDEHCDRDQKNQGKDQM